MCGVAVFVQWSSALGRSIASQDGKVLFKSECVCVYKLIIHMYVYMYDQLDCVLILGFLLLFCRVFFGFVVYLFTKVLPHLSSLKQ